MSFDSKNFPPFSPKYKKEKFEHLSPNRTRNSGLTVSVLALVITCFALTGHAADTSSSFGLMDAKDRGTTAAGTVKGTATPTFDESIKKDVLEISYTVAKGTTLGIWAKNFPTALAPSTANTVKVNVKIPNREQLTQVSAVLQIKGAKDTQTVPLKLKLGWSTVQEAVAWEKIGTLQDAVLVIAPADTTESAAGTLSYALEFVNVKIAPKAADASKALSATAAPIPAPKRTPAPPKEAYSLMDAGDKGVMNDGEAKSTMTPTFDEVVEKDVFEIDYSLPKDTQTSLWAKDFPLELTSSAVNTVKIGIRVLDAKQLDQISVEAGIKGTKSVQTIPLKLKLGWNSFREMIDWNSIGNLEQIALVVTPTEKTETASGTLSIAVDFIKGPALKKTGSVTDSFRVFDMFDAGEKGVFNIGPSQGNITTAFDESLAKDVWKFGYTLPAGSVVGVWTKSYPTELNTDRVDAIQIDIKPATSKEIDEASVKVEVKGEKGMQTFPLILESKGRSMCAIIDWNRIGKLTEVVLVVSPMVINKSLGDPTVMSATEPGTTATEPAVTGSLNFNFRFGKINFLAKHASAIKAGLVVLAALLLALLAGFIRKQFDLDNLFAGGKNRTIKIETSSFLSQLPVNLFYGIIIVLMAGATIRIYAHCPIAYFDLGFLVVGLIGVLIAWLFKYQFTGKHLNATEVFQNFLVAGLLAASSSKIDLLQPPSTWGQILNLSHVTAAVTFVVYQVFNAISLGSSRKHLNAIHTALIVGTPFLFGWLLLLENPAVVHNLLDGITFHVLKAWPLFLEIVSRLIIVFIFNEAVLNGFTLSIKGKTVSTAKAHLYIFLVSLAVVISPEIADLGANAFVAGLPTIVRALVAVLTTMLSYAGLWGEVYLITGILIDAGHHIAPSEDTIFKHVNIGVRKGMAFIGILMAMLYILYMILNASLAQKIMSSAPLLIGVLAGTLLYPLVKTIVETFDGSLKFFERVRYSYKNGALYARGAVAGFGFACMITQGMFQKSMSERVLFGLIIGLIASGGVSFLRDAYYMIRHRGKIQSWRLYLVDSCLGIFVGSAAAFYLDSSQVPVIIEKFKLYMSPVLTGAQLNQFNAGTFSAEGFYNTLPLVMKWGYMNLGRCTGGSKLIFLESLAGVINWAVAAWLFAINKVFMQAYFDKDSSPIKFFFSRAGFAMLMEHMVYVLRWGLWMSPIIFTFLRMMPTPTWYNQDGAIRTFAAIFHNLTSSPEAFQAWSLKMFVWIMAFDFFRVLIWMDHMGLRVATLVNLSFLGMDKFDEKISKFIGPAAAQRYIPEGVKRFTTWAPLLIPFYIPRGAAWDYAWNTSEAIQNATRGKGFIPWLQSLSLPGMLLLIAASVLVCTGISWGVRVLRARSRKRQIAAYNLTNRDYRVNLKENGEGFSEVLSKEFFDVTRRSYDTIDPCGKILFVVDTAKKAGEPGRFWPVMGNFPKQKFQGSTIEKGDDCLKITNTSFGVKTVIEMTLPDQDSTAEILKVTVENQTGQSRQLKIVSYIEWVLNGWIHDRFHTQYARLYPEMEYAADINSILTWHKATKSMGFLASDIAPEGFLTARVEFVGRAKSIWTPRVMETMHFLEARNTPSYPTFDPIGSLMIDAALEPKATKTVRMIVGYAKNRKVAVEMIKKLLKPWPSKTALSAPAKKRVPLIGHGEIPPGTPQPYSEFADNGNKLRVHTPYTPRPIDHAMSNAIHSMMVTNRGLHTSCNGNSQQNRLTPDWADTVTKEIPTEAIYLYDADSKEWFSPTYHPLNDASAKHECEFGVDGTAVFRMNKGIISTELTLFVPPDEPAGVYLLTVKNSSSRTKRLRVAPYFQMVLSFMPEKSGPLHPRYDKDLNAIFYENPRNIFRSGPAFVTMSVQADRVETNRGRFFGSGLDMARPYFVENGEPDATQMTDDGQIAGFLGTLEVPARSETTVAIVLGQTEEKKQAQALIQKLKTVESARKSLQDTRSWWLSLMGTLKVETTEPQFDYYQNWLKYQAIAERIWPRRGFYQTSGAYGFRDQLQDTVGLTWVDPALARKQILLCASQQFLEGDVFHWFFTLTDGRTAFSCRSHASDNPLWIAWAVGEYLRITGDESILDEMTSYLYSEFPFAPLPKNKQGWGHLYHRTTRSDTVFRHCMVSIDLVLKKRTGKNGLPLMGVGDWNDGLDEIGSEGKGESVWLGLFLYYILKNIIPVIEKKDGAKAKAYYSKRLKDLGEAIEKTWREDRYLRAFHDDGTEIGLKGSGIWEIDALTAAWAVMAGINFERNVTVFNTALSVLEKEDTILLGWPALREDTKPYLGRSSKYPEGVRENGMYCHGVQWLVRAARILAEEFEKRGDRVKADEYRATAYRLWLKVSPIPHVTPQKIEIYGGQPNKQAADMLTNFDIGRMIWHGYTGAAGWMLRQAMEGVVGAVVVKNEMVLPEDLSKPRGTLKINRVQRDVSKSPFHANGSSGKGLSESARANLRSKTKDLSPEVGAGVE